MGKNINQEMIRVAKLPMAVHSQAVQCNLRSILRQSSKFHLVITFHCRVTAIFVKVVFVAPREFECSKMYVKNEQRIAIKFCFPLKKSAGKTVKFEVYTDEEQLGDLMTSISKKPSPKAEIPLHGFPMMNGY